MDELKKLEDTKTALHKDIEKYGADLESIQTAIAEAEKVTFDIEALKKELSDLTITKNDLIAVQTEVETIGGTKTSLLSDIEECKKIIASMADTAKEAEALQTIKENIKAEIKVLEERKEISSTDLSNISLAISAKNTDLATLESYHTERKGQITSDLTEKETIAQDHLKDLQKDINDKNSENDGLIFTLKRHREEIESLGAKIADLKVAHESLESTYENKKTIKEAELVGMGKDAEAKESELNQREGDLSLKENSYESKRTNLMMMKSRLEKELGKSINIEI